MLNRIQKIARLHSVNKKVSYKAFLNRSFSSSDDKGLPLVFIRHGQSTWNQQNIFIGNIFYFNMF